MPTIESVESSVISAVTAFRKHCSREKDWDGQLSCHCAHRWVLYRAGDNSPVSTDEYPSIIDYVLDVVASNGAQSESPGAIIESRIGGQMYAKRFFHAHPVNSHGPTATGCTHSSLYSSSYVGASLVAAMPSNERNPLNG